MSLGHCLGMCGPLLAACAAAQPPVSPWRRLPGQLLYHGGRILTYGALGFAGGLLGAAAGRAGGDSPRWPGALSLALGAAMLALALGMLGAWSGARRLESAGLARRVTAGMGRLLATRRSGGRLLLGMANGLLPCGPVYAVALGTPTAGRPWHGAAAMLLFGLGTLPVLVAFGLGAGRLAPAAQAPLHAGGRGPGGADRPATGAARGGGLGLDRASALGAGGFLVVSGLAVAVGVYFHPGFRSCHLPIRARDLTVGGAIPPREAGPAAAPAACCCAWRSRWPRR